MLRKYLFGFLIMALLPVIGLAQDEPPAEDPYPWWNDRVWYEIFVRSFRDSNGDGVGDFQGLTDSLDYLNDGDPETTDDLGITGIWLMPISPSPSYHGYDVIDYRGINPEYGTMEDFQAFMAAAHERGITVIVDLVVNHSGVDHPWFVASRQDPDGEFGDWYRWRDEDPNLRGPEGGVVWHQADDRYYYGVFWSGMPDLNYDTPAVTEEMYDIARFWLEDLNVDGFRLDAIKYIVEDDNVLENSIPTEEWLAGFHDHVESVDPDTLLVGEAWTSTNLASNYVDEAVDIVFEFDLAIAILRGASFGISSSIHSQMETVLESYPPGQYATFLTNHDQNRVINQLNGDYDSARVAASVYMTLPGVPFIYYGEEIGMTGTKPDPEIRTPMQWGGPEPGIGFTVALPWSPVNPDWADGITVADQTDDPDSLLSHYRNLVHLRNATPALRYGDYTPIDAGPGNVFAALRQTEDQAVLVVVNLRDRLVDDYGMVLEASGLGNVTDARALFGTDAQITLPDVNAEGGFADYRPLPEIPPLATIIIELETDAG
jgi:alpha-amylase